ncbi:MAG: dTDP-4-dehydrorhamnose reductase [Burkholderiales bacterium]
MKVLLTGGTGQVGTAFAAALPGAVELIAPPRAGFDLSRPDTLAAVLRAAAPDVIVNAAAMTAVERAEREPALAQTINADAVAMLAATARELDALLIHFSTDYVFDGRKPGPYAETDATAPLNIYGASKLAGEAAIRASGARHLILRTGWVYSATGRNFLTAILEQAAQAKELRVVDDQHGAPTWATDIAGIAVTLAQALPAEPAGSTRLGTFHCTATGETTWFGFAQAILEETAALGVDPRARLVPVTAAEYGAAAVRPANSRLACEKFVRTFGADIPLHPWRASLRHCLQLHNPAASHRAP